MFGWTVRSLLVLDLRVLQIFLPAYISRQKYFSLFELTAVILRLNSLSIKLHKTSIGSGTVFRNQKGSRTKLWGTASILDLHPLQTSPNNISPKQIYFAVGWAVGGRSGQRWAIRTRLASQKRVIRGGKRTVGGRDSWQEKTGSGVSRTQCCSFYGATHLDHFYIDLEMILSML